MKIGGYMIVVEGDPPREFSAIDSLSAPVEGREMLIEDSLYIVTRIRTDQDFEATSEPDKIHTYPRVFVRRLGAAPTQPPRDENDDDDSSHESATVLKFKVIPLDNYQSTEVDDLAELRAWIAHEKMAAEQQEQRQEAACTRVFVRPIERSESFDTRRTRLDNAALAARREYEGTEADDFAEARARAAHEVQRLRAEEQRPQLPAEAEQPAPAILDSSPRTILPWQSRR